MDPMYHSFLVRFWTSESDEPPIWHISLESVRTKEVRLFANLEDMFGFLKILMRLPPTSKGKSLCKTDQQSENSVNTLPDKKPYLNSTRGG